MSKKLLLALVLMVSAAWVYAQDPASSPSQGSSASQGSSSDQMGSTSAGETSVEGCLSGSSGNFTLTADSGTTYQLSGDTSKLSKHVGHEVQVTGTTSGAGSSASTSGSTGSSASSGTGMSSGSQTLNVTKVKHISETCKSAGSNK
jgi:hypothetical protein